METSEKMFHITQLRNRGGYIHEISSIDGKDDRIGVQKNEIKLAFRKLRFIMRQISPFCDLLFVCFLVLFVHFSLGGVLMKRQGGGFGEHKPQVWSGPACFDKDGTMKFVSLSMNDKVDPSGAIRFSKAWFPAAT